MTVAEIFGSVKEGMRMGITGEVSKDRYLKALESSEREFLLEIIGYLEKYHQSHGTELWAIGVGSSVANIFNKEPYYDIDIAIYKRLYSSSLLRRQLIDIFRHRRIGVETVLVPQETDYPIESLVVRRNQNERIFHLLPYDTHPEMERDEHKTLGTMKDKPWTELLRLGF